MGVTIITKIGITGSMYVIFHLKERGQETVNDLMADNEVGRLTILSRDGSKISGDYTGLIVLVEGVEERVLKAVELVGDRGEKLKDEKASEIYSKLKDESEDADQGVGFLFG